MQRNFVTLTAIFFLSACNGPAGDPYARVGTWRDQHYNDSNLKAMVANPADLQLGHGDDTAIGETATDAVIRLRTGKVRPLAISGVADIQTVNTGAAPGTGSGQ